MRQFFWDELYFRQGNSDKGLPLAIAAAEGIVKRNYKHESSEQIIKNLIAYLKQTNRISDADFWNSKLAEFYKQKTN